MKSRIFLLAIILVCLSWIVYVSYDIVSKQNAINFTEYFSAEDGRVVVIHHADEVNWQENNLQALAENSQIIESIKQKMPQSTSVFISEKRSLLVIQKVNNWRQEEVNQLFTSGIFPFEIKGSNRFTFGKYSGVVSDNQIMLHKLDNLTLSGVPLEPDSKSSFSLIYWENSDLIYEDVYCRKDKNITYKRYPNKKELKQSIDDKQKFSGNIPSNFDRYEFYSLEEFGIIDSSFLRTVFKEIISTGLVIVEKDEQKVVLFDFKENQLPIQSINERFGFEENNEDFAEFDSLVFSTKVDTLGRKLYVAQFEDFGVISYDKSYFDEVVTDVNLGKSLSMDSKKMDQLYGDLPLNVSVRIVDSVMCFAKTHVGNQTIETIVKRKSLLSDESLKDVKDYFSMNPGERVLGFGSFDERGNCIVFTESKKLHGYLNGLKKWTQDLSEIPSSIELSLCRKYLIVNLANEARIYPKNGTLLATLPKSPLIEPVIISLNGIDIAFTVNGQKFIEYQLNGVVNRQFVINEIINEVVYSKELGKVLLLTNTGYYSYDPRTKKSPKKLELGKTFTSLGRNASNCLVHQQGNSLTWLNYSNGQLKSIAIPNVKIHDILETPQGTAIVISSGNSIQAILVDGQLLWKQTFEGTEISKIITGRNSKGISILCVLDALENQSYILDAKGAWLSQNTLHAEKDIKITTFGAEGYSITTFLGSYVVQYNR
jgi:hypothetical protein